MEASTSKIVTTTAVVGAFFGIYLITRDKTPIKEPGKNLTTNLEILYRIKAEEEKQAEYIREVNMEVVAVLVIAYFAYQHFLG